MKAIHYLIGTIIYLIVIVGFTLIGKPVWGLSLMLIMTGGCYIGGIICLFRLEGGNKNTTDNITPYTKYDYLKDVIEIKESYLKSVIKIQQECFNNKIDYLQQQIDELRRK